MHFSRESVFISSIRSFFTSFSVLLGIFAALVATVFILMFLAGPNIYPDRSVLTLAPDASGNRDLLGSTSPVILKLNIHGVIGQGDLTTDNMVNCLLDSRDGMLHGNRVKAILLDINSPGGTVTDSDGIYQALIEYKKKYSVPVYAFVDGLCASGGMYIACAADKVFASSSSVIGSVGVILGPTFNFSKLLQTYGVDALTITEGKDKDMLNPFRPWVPGEDQCLRNVVGSLYERFVSIVTSARPSLSKTALVEKYGAQIFVAKQAEEFGYIDLANTDYNTALSQLAQAAHLSESMPYQVFEIEPPHPFLSNLASSKLSFLTGKFTHQVQLHPSLHPDLYGKFLYLYEPSLSQE